MASADGSRICPLTARRVRQSAEERMSKRNLLTRLGLEEGEGVMGGGVTRRPLVTPESVEEDVMYGVSK